MFSIKNDDLRCPCKVMHEKRAHCIRQTIQHASQVLTAETERRNMMTLARRNSHLGKGKLYDLDARQLTTPAEIDRILPGLVRQNGIEATGVRWDPEPERYPGTQMRQWFLRLESATR